ncbi:DUF1295 domain-containing protein [Anaerorhabdus sp.]|uniref:DUF1295 domain-containing protein n=1 Tax=Anaerorhabdus sp. TaxID=1872524 RepID=UPI002FCC5967
MSIGLLSFIIVVVYFFLFFLVGTSIRNNSIVDMGWGIGFVILNLILYLINQQTIGSFLFTILLSIWGVRLFIHIFKRNIGKPEDFRYAAWRKEWGKWVVLRAFFQVYLLQAIFMWIVAFPIHTMYPVRQSINYLTIIGMIIWLIGFGFETISDKQLSTFVSNPQNKGKIIETGLWRYSRHPNYFGEASLWWGLALISFSLSNNGLSFIGSAFITFSLCFISGVPFLEKRNASKPGYTEYKRKTSVFIPWFVKK